MDITTPDNPADTVVTLKISGNRLVSICNAVQGMMHETGKINLPWYRELDEVIERVRDQLGEQRMAVHYDDGRMCVCPKCMRELANVSAEWQGPKKPA